MTATQTTASVFASVVIGRNQRRHFIQGVSLSRWLYLTQFVASWETLFEDSKNNQGMPDMNINVVPLCGHRLVKSVAFHF